MSYILDALRRAEADRERERGQVPGLHTQPLSGNQAASQRRWLPWLGGGLLLLAGIGAGSWWASGQHETVPPAPPTAPAPLATAAPPAEVASAALAAPPSLATPQPAASASPYLPPAPPPGAEATAPPRPALTPAPAVAALPAPTAAPAPPPAPAAEAPIPRLAELPESLRREVPRLVISGSVYSEEPSGRFAMINGEVLREGAQLGPDFVLEQIRPRELVLRFRGQRYRQPV